MILPRRRTHQREKQNPKCQKKGHKVEYSDGGKNYIRKLAKCHFSIAVGVKSIMIEIGPENERKKARLFRIFEYFEWHQQWRVFWAAQHIHSPKEKRKPKYYNMEKSDSIRSYIIYINRTWNSHFVPPQSAPTVSSCLVLLYGLLAHRAGQTHFIFSVIIHFILYFFFNFFFRFFVDFFNKNVISWCAFGWFSGSTRYNILDRVWNIIPIIHTCTYSTCIYSILLWQ